MEDSASLKMENWPDAVAFVPYVGSRYLEGFGGRRVLLLGESHYREDGWTDDPALTRPFTRKTFGDMETCERKGGGKVLRRVGSVADGQWDTSAFRCSAGLGTRRLLQPFPTFRWHRSRASPVGF